MHILESLLIRYNDSVKRLITVNDKVFAVPMCMSVIGLVGNMDVLKKCGVNQMPETYGQWLDSMEKVKKKGCVPMVNYLSSDTSTGFLMAGRSVAPYVLGEKKQNSNDTAETVFKKGIYDLSHLIDTGYIDREQLLAKQDGEAYANVLGKVFAKGEAAYAILPSWGMISFLEDILMNLVKAGQVVADTDPRIPFNLVKALRNASLKLAKGKQVKDIARMLLKQKKTLERDLGGGTDSQGNCISLLRVHRRISS